MTQILEIARFRPAPGTDEATLRNAAESVDPWLRRQPGFLHRLLRREEGDTWIDVIVWASPVAVDAADIAFAVAPETRYYQSVIDPASVTIHHRPLALSMPI
ncbi:MAG TPA: antibiotic biosynthesis monooxygenase [Paracoccaceae bacterium]|nr:antibiotic biosynthesis monooxygenase [Paracoccaceae bacterium]